MLKILTMLKEYRKKNGVLGTFDGFIKILRDQMDDKERRFKLTDELINL